MNKIIRNLHDLEGSIWIKENDKSTFEMLVQVNFDEFKIINLPSGNRSSDAVFKSNEIDEFFKWTKEKKYKKMCNSFKDLIEIINSTLYKKLY
jgi:hypothetical protein